MIKKIILTFTLITLLFFCCDNDAYASTVRENKNVIFNIHKSGENIKVIKNDRLIYKKKIEIKYMYTNTTVNIRKGPSSKSYIYKTIPSGYKVKQITTLKEDKWSLIRLNGSYYFIKSIFLSKTSPIYCPTVYNVSSFKNRGVISWGGWKWTWYSTREGSAGYVTGIPGRWTDSRGCVRDGKGYLCLASSSLRKGTVVNTPFGIKGKVYDCGCARGVLDLYTTW